MFWTFLPTYLTLVSLAFNCRWGGPLPQTWLDQQLEMQKRILDRMYEFGMNPGASVIE